MIADFPFAVLAFTSLLAIVNPLSAATIFLALSGEDSPPRRRRSVGTALVTGAAVLVAFAAAGGAILGFFGITTYAFQGSSSW